MEPDPPEVSSLLKADSYHSTVNLINLKRQITSPLLGQRKLLQSRTSLVTGDLSDIKPHPPNHTPLYAVTSLIPRPFTRFVGVRGPGYEAILILHMHNYHNIAV